MIETAPPFSIPFLQYILQRPQQQILIQVDKDHYRKAAYIMLMGHRFEIEILRNGTVSVTVFDIKEETDIAMQLYDNKPGKPREAVHKLIDEAFSLIN
jgi:hypothetical protein